jgi:pimeloyl-ACP methyl ester carboxylesterase
MKIAPLSVRDYADDVVALVDSLDSPPLLVGLSLGGLLAQLVAARTRHAGVIAACPVPAAGVVAATPATVLSLGSIWGRHFLQPRPWANPVYPPPWQRFRHWLANAQTEEAARELFADLVCESGRACCELFSFLDRGKASTVDFAAVTTPVLVIRGEYDRVVPPQIAPKTAARYQRGSHVEIPGADHLAFSGAALPATMSRIDDWIAKNHALGLSSPKN